MPKTLDSFKGMSRTEEIDDKIDNIAEELRKLKARTRPKKKVNILSVIVSLDRDLRPRKAEEVPEKYLRNAIDSYASAVRIEDIIAINGADFFTRGRKGVPYTREVLYVDCYPDQAIRYDDIAGVYQYDAMIDIKTANKSIRYDDQKYMKQVYEILKRCV